MGVRVTWEGSPRGVCVFCFVPREVAKEKAGEVPITQRYMIPSLKEPGTHPPREGAQNVRKSRRYEETSVTAVRLNEERTTRPSCLEGLLCERSARGPVRSFFSQIFQGRVPVARC